MPSTSKIVEQMRREPANIRFADLLKVCEELFGKPRPSGSRYMVFKTPWPGDPRVNLQNDRGKAKTYPVVVDVVADMTESGEVVPVPLAEKHYSGEFRVRIPPQVHRSLAMEAAEQGVSLNRLASAKLAS